MAEVLVGILAVLIGLFLCFSGQWALRLLLALWGGLIGFGLGAGLADSINSQGIFGSLLSWILGIALAVLFAALAYIWYAVAIVLALAGAGYAIGATFAAAIGLSSGWPVAVIGVLFAVALAVIAIIGDVPQILLIIASAMAGASVTIAGVMLIVSGTAIADLPLFERPASAMAWWYIAMAVLSILGIVAQLRQLRSLRDPVRRSWQQSSGTASRR